MGRTRRGVALGAALGIFLGALFAGSAGASGESYGSAEELRSEVGSRLGCAEYASLGKTSALIPTRGAYFGACRGTFDGEEHELLLAAYGKERIGEALLLSLAYFACSGGEAELDRWHYVSGPGWVVGVDALAMGRAVLGLQSYPPPDVTGTSKLTRALGKRLDATAHEVDCGRYQELSAQRTRPTDEQIREMLAGTAPRRDQRDEASKEGDGYRQPTTEPIATITVQALPTLRFQAANFDTRGGVNEIVLRQESGGTHTLLFEEPELRGFDLAVDTQTPEDRGRVDLRPGTYTIYCRIPGHRAAGMEATITVT